MNVNLDPNWVMAASTVALVGVTAFYAWRTSTIANATKDMAQATARSVDVSTTTLILQHAPIIIQRVASAGGSTAPDGQWKLGIGIHNIGAAPAFGVSVTVAIGPHEFPGGPYPTIEKDADPRLISCGVRYGDFDAAGKDWSAIVRYADLLSRSYELTRSLGGAIEMSLDGEPLRLPSSLRDQSD